MKISLYTNWYCWKQRPHHLAEFLSTQNELHIYSMKSLRSKGPSFPVSTARHTSTLFPSAFKGVSEQINRAIKKKLSDRFLSKQDGLKIYSAPPTLGLTGKSSSSPFVYDCLDDWSGLLQESSGFEDIQQDLLRRAHKVWVVSRKLYRDLEPQFKDKLLYVPNGVAFSDFRHVVDIRCNGKERPVLGYVGAVDYWFDQPLIKALHDLLPEWEIHIIGPVRVDVSMLSSLPRVKMFGRVSYGDLPRYMARFDIAMIPFTINNLIEATSPIKLFEYLAAGLPVVSTPMPEVLPFVEEGVVGCGSTSKEWASIITNLLGSSNSAKCQEVGYANSWSKIFEKAIAASLF